MTFDNGAAFRVTLVAADDRFPRACLSVDVVNPGASDPDIATAAIPAATRPPPVSPQQPAGVAPASLAAFASKFDITKLTGAKAYPPFVGALLLYIFLSQFIEMPTFVASL